MIEMEKLCLCQLRLEQHSDDVCSAFGNNSRALFVEERGCLKEKCCSVLRLRDALTIASECASVFYGDKMKRRKVLHYTAVYIHDLR